MDAPAISATAISATAIPRTAIPTTARGAPAGRPHFSLPQPGSPQTGEGPPAEAAPAAIDGVECTELVRHADQRGWLIELCRTDELPLGLVPAMAYVSQTLPGVTRGPHEHVAQTDVFAFVGPGEFEVWLWDARADSPTFGRRSVLRAGASRPLRVVVPPGVVHAYRNVGPEPGWVFNCPDQLYAGRGKGEPVDEIRHEHDPASPYRLS